MKDVLTLRKAAPVEEPNTDSRQTFCAMVSVFDTVRDATRNALNDCTLLLFASNPELGLDPAATVVGKAAFAEGVLLICRSLQLNAEESQVVLDAAHRGFSDSIESYRAVIEERAVAAAAAA